MPLPAYLAHRGGTLEPVFVSDRPAVNAHAARFDPIEAFLESPAAQARIAAQLARSNAVAAKRAARPIIAPEERARRRKLNATRKRIFAALREWATVSGLPADEYIVTRLACVSQRALYREYLAWAATHRPDLAPMHNWLWNLYALRQMHGAKGSPSRVRVEAAAKARGDRYFHRSRSTASTPPLTAPNCAPGATSTP